MFVHPPLLTSPLIPIMHSDDKVNEPPGITLQTPDDEGTAPVEVVVEAVTPEERMKTSTSAPELHKLAPSPSKRRLPVPTDLPGIQGQDVVNEMGDKKGLRSLFVPEVEEVRVR